MHVYFKVQRKRVETSMDPSFEQPVFNTVRKKMKRVIRQLEKPQEALETWEQQDIFRCKTAQIF